MRDTQLTASARDLQRACVGPKPWLGILLLTALSSCAAEQKAGNLPNAATADAAAPSLSSVTAGSSQSAGAKSNAGETGLLTGQAAAGNGDDAAGRTAPSASDAGSGAQDAGSPTPPTNSTPVSSGGSGGVGGATAGSGGGGAGAGSGGAGAGGSGARGGHGGAGGTLPIGSPGLPTTIEELTAGALAPIPCTTEADCNDSQAHVLALVPICDAASGTCVACPTKAEHDAQASRIINCVSAMVFAGCMTDACIAKCQSPCL
jgi:hypothetical protein